MAETNPRHRIKNGCSIQIGSRVGSRLRLHRVFRLFAAPCPGLASPSLNSAGNVTALAGERFVQQEEEKNMSPSASCKKCLDMRCACRSKHATRHYLGQWSDGPSDQGAWCTCCLSQVLAAVQTDQDVTMRELTLRLLVTLAVNPDQYVREEPADPTGWNGRGRCWHPTNCQTREKHTEKLKKSRSENYFTDFEIGHRFSIRLLAVRL